jgi:hypothetical protein
LGNILSGPGVKTVCPYVGVNFDHGRGTFTLSFTPRGTHSTMGLKEGLRPLWAKFTPVTHILIYIGIMGKQNHPKIVKKSLIVSEK